MPIDQHAVDDLLARARREVDDGLLPSCQVALGYRGEVVVFETFSAGKDDGAGGAGDDTRYAIFSSTKAFVAAAMWQLIGEARVDAATRVAELVPEFGTHGKDVITIEQVMLHTSGFPYAPLGPPAWYTREGRFERFARWRL